MSLMVMIDKRLVGNVPEQEIAPANQAVNFVFFIHTDNNEQMEF